MVKISAKFDFIYWSYCPKTPKIGPNWVMKKNKKNNKKGYLKGKVENGKYPDLKTYKFIKYGKMRML